MKTVGEPARRLDGKYTYADYKNWSNDERWEIIAGEAWDMSPAPSRKHQWLVMELGTRFNYFLRNRKCQIYPAPFDVFFPDEENELEDSINTIVQPDLTLICDKNKLIDKGCFGAPDLVVEILSPYTSKKDLDEKFHLYEKSGVKEYWVVDPGSSSIQVFTLDENLRYKDGKVFVHEGELKTKLLEGFSIDLHDLFSKMNSA